MTDYEDAEAAHRLQSERASGSPAPIPNPHAKPKPLTSFPLGHNVFTVVYFMPDGEAVIRYEREHATPDTHLAMQSFAVIKVIPSVNGGEPSIEFLKFRGDLSEYTKDAEDDSRNHPIGCTCIMCIPGG